MRSVINASLGTCAKPFAEEEPTDHSIRWVGRERPLIPLGWWGAGAPSREL